MVEPILTNVPLERSIWLNPDSFMPTRRVALNVDLGRLQELASLDREQCAAEIGAELLAIIEAPIKPTTP